VADERQIEHVKRVPAVGGDGVRGVGALLEHVGAHPGMVVAQVVARAQLQVVEAQVVDPAPPHRAGDDLALQAGRFVGGVAHLDQRGWFQALVAQRDHHVAPARFVNAFGDHLQAGRNVLRRLNLAGDAVKLDQTVALAAGSLRLLLQAFDQAVVLDAEGGLSSEDFQRLDDGEGGPAARLRLVHADQSQQLPARPGERDEQQVVGVPGARAAAHALLQHRVRGQPGGEPLSALGGQEVTVADAVALLHQAMGLFERRRGLAQFLKGGQRQAGLGGAAQYAGFLVYDADQHGVEAHRLLDAVGHFFKQFLQAGSRAEHFA